MADAERGNAPRVLLVHGTFARRSPWTRPGSALHDQLGEALPHAAIDRFEWRGRNRHGDRSSAADSLAQELRHRRVPTVVVAHSHGGNVATAALSILQRDRQHDPASDSGRVRLVTVATPFLRYERHDAHASLAWGRISWLSFSAALGLVMSVGMLQLGLQPAGSGPAGDLSQWARLGDLPRALASFSAGLGTILLGAVVVAVLLAATARVLTRSAPRPLGAGTDLGGGGHTAIRTDRDEAALLLRFGRRLTAATTAARRTAGGVPGTFALVVFLLGGTVVMAWALGAEEQLPTEDRWTVASALQMEVTANGLDISGDASAVLVAAMACLLTVAGSVALAACVLTVVEALVCGVDGIPLLAAGRAMISSRPPNQRFAEVTVSLSDRHLRGLRHSRLHTDTAGRDAIVDAVDRSLRSMGAHPPSRRETT